MLAKKSSVHRCMSGKNSITRGFYPNHITHIPTSKVKWSAPEVDSLRVKTNLILGWGSIIARSLVGGCGGILHQKMFKFGGSEMLFSALVMRSVSKTSTLNIKMANNLLQVTIIKITESKEKSSILRLYVRGLWLCFVTDQKLN